MYKNQFVSFVSSSSQANKTKQKDLINPEASDYLHCVLSTQHGAASRIYNKAQALSGSIHGLQSFWNGNTAEPLIPWTQWYDLFHVAVITKVGISPKNLLRDPCMDIPPPDTKARQTTKKPWTNWPHAKKKLPQVHSKHMIFETYERPTPTPRSTTFLQSFNFSKVFLQFATKPSKTNLTNL